MNRLMGLYNIKKRIEYKFDETRLVDNIGVFEDSSIGTFLKLSENSIQITSQVSFSTQTKKTIVAKEIIIITENGKDISAEIYWIDLATGKTIRDFILKKGAKVSAMICGGKTINESIIYKVKDVKGFSKNGCFYLVAETENYINLYDKETKEYKLDLLNTSILEVECGAIF